MKKNTEFIDDDIFVFNEDDLDLTDEELELSEELESQNIDDKTSNNINNYFDFEDFENYSEFNDFEITDLNNDNDKDFNLDEHDYNDLQLDSMLINPLQLDNSTTKKTSNKKSNDILNMDFETLDEYLDLSNDSSMIKDSKNNNIELNKEDSEYLDGILENELNEEELENEHLQNMNYQELNNALNIETIEKNKKTHKNSNKNNKLFDKISSKFKNKNDNNQLNIDLNKRKEIENQEQEEKNASDEILNSDFNFNDFENTFDDLSDSNIEDFDSSKVDLLDDYDFDELIDNEETLPIDDYEDLTDFDNDNIIENNKEINTESQLNNNEEILPIDDYEDLDLSDCNMEEFDNDDMFESNSNDLITDISINKSNTDNSKKTLDNKKEKVKKQKETTKTKPQNISSIINPFISIFSIIAISISIYNFVLIHKNQNISNNLSNVTKNIQTNIDDINNKITNMNSAISDVNNNLSEQESKNNTSWSEIVKTKYPTTVALTSTIETTTETEKTIIKNDGTGVIIDKNDNELIILTNQHVVSSTNDVTVIFSNNISVNGKVKNSDESKDLATISVPLTSLTDDILNNISIAELSTEDTSNVGDEVIAIGNSLGKGLSVTKGIISAKNKSVETSSNKKLENLIQTDTAINSGNSGGPLFNSNGQLIGICVAKADDKNSEGINFVIPIAPYIDTINNLK